MTIKEQARREAEARYPAPQRAHDPAHSWLEMAYQAKVDLNEAKREGCATTAEHYLTQLAERDKVIEGLRAGNKNKEHLGASEDGPGSTALTGPNAQAPAAGQTPSIPRAKGRFSHLFAHPKEAECDICGVVWPCNSWGDYSHHCPDCTIVSKRFRLAAEVDAHHAFAEGGCDMYGSQAHPDLDRGWLDGYIEARYEDLLARYRRGEEVEHVTFVVMPPLSERVSDRSGTPQPASGEEYSGERGPQGDAQIQSAP